ncbi:MULTISPECIES: NGG1p interacting factor NIF3 [unclassified Endozoicomonas]|uniref:NGG1p interacting factor NIF3 n=1 Tax=unclassified Endozoicomonas TaxID=2644528 RepID=UPI003BAF55FD
MSLHKLCFFVPESHLESVKTAVFAAGAGRYEKYDNCCWQTLGQGQFRALDGSDPFIGSQGKLETVQEFKVEMICEDQYLKAAIAALKSAHPYEEPAFESWPLGA